MNRYCYLLFVLFISCDYLSVKPPNNQENGLPIASVYHQKLYKTDIEDLLPKNLSKSDSTVLVKNLINSWAIQQLLLKKAEENISEINSNEINDLVKNYRKSLFINDYKERLIKQQLDTIIETNEINRYYSENKENFKLNEALIQLKYIYFGNDFLDKDLVIRKFKSSKKEDLETLEDLTINFKAFQLSDSTWFTVGDVLKRIPPFEKEPKEKLLKISKYTKKEDSLGVYLVAVKDILKRNDIAPKSYIKPQIKQLILHKRKLELIRSIEKTLIEDATKNKDFKEN